MCTIISGLGRVIGLVLLVLAGWSLIMLAMPFMGSPGRQLAVVGDQGRAARAVFAAGGRIIEVKRGAILARSDRAGFAASLYRNGALLVLEGRVASGCFPAAE